jgi:hypothetical protein
MCRLGKWYYQGEGNAKYSSFNAFKQLEKPHSEVHTNGLAAMVAYKEGHSEEALMKLSLMENASFKVIDLLSSLSSQISADS